MTVSDLVKALKSLRLGRLAVKRHVSIGDYVADNTPWIKCICYIFLVDIVHYKYIYFIYIFVSYREVIIIDYHNYIKHQLFSYFKCNIMASIYKTKTNYSKQVDSLFQSEIFRAVHDDANF